MQVTASRPLTIAGPAGDLEALLDEPAAAARAAAVVCHPHPLHQGTMHNKVVHTLARTFRERGVAVLRFNFRGVGTSAGVHDHGSGERDDVAAAAAWCRERWPGLELLLGGFSFGAAMALLTADRIQARGLVTIALPVERVAGAAPPSCPWLLVHGTADEIVPAAALEEWLAGLSAQPELELIDAADHFFNGELQMVAERVGRFLAARFPELAADGDDAARAL